MTTTDTEIADSTPPAPDPAPARWFRPDVDGLRAVAIVAVVAFHAGVPGFAGGFVGVDVFFVISGYLITTKLLRECEADGRVSVLAFWGKRIRRLMPAMTVMLVATFLLSALILSPRELPEVAASGAAAALYLSNVHFANADTSYFGRYETENPFLHTWSLGVEEQFYLVWPLLIWGAAAFALRRRVTARSTIVVVLAGVAVLSFIVELSLTADASPWAFYGPQSRAWQFALAGLYVALARPDRWTDQRTRTLAVLGGLALMAFAVVTTTKAGYPGLPAVVPVVATLLVIAGGDGRPAGPAGPSAWLAHPAMQWTGRVSYSWYLWHWPFMVLASALLVSGSVWVRLGAAGVALVVAAAMYRYVENPIRLSTSLRRSLRVTYLLAVGALAVGLLAALAVHLYGDAARSRPDTVALQAVYDENHDYPCLHDATSPTGIAYCEDGDLDGSRTVMLTGDSHAGQWLREFGDVAAESDIHLVIRWRGACPAVPAGITIATGRDTFCDAYRADTLTLVGELEPDVVVVTQSGSYIGTILGDGSGSSPLSHDDELTEWQRAYGRLIDDVEATGSTVAIVVDNPVQVDDPLACLGRPNADAERCSTGRDQALAPIADLKAAEARVIADRDVTTMDVTDDLCSPDRCAVTSGETVVYANRSHLAEQWTVTRDTEVRDFLERALAR